MVSQIRSVLGRYRDGGGQVREQLFEGSGHAPLIDASQSWSELFFAHLDAAEKA